jgi:hypothetical protein
MAQALYEGKDEIGDSCVDGDIYDVDDALGDRTPLVSVIAFGIEVGVGGESSGGYSRGKQ